MQLINPERSGSITLDQFVALDINKTVESKGDDFCALFLDVETTGVSFDDDRITQLACRPVLLDKTTCKVTKYAGIKTTFNDPGIPIPLEVQELTGIKDADVIGHNIDWEWLSRIIEKVDFVVCHNARFDKHFVRKHFQENDVQMPSTIWACSLNQIDWVTTCRAGRSLETLGVWHGFYYNAHDAGRDVDALIHLFNNSNRSKELFEKCQQSQYRVFACNFPRGKNDVLKSRRYRWDPDISMWWKGCDDEQSAEGESTWLLSSHGCEAQIFEVKAHTLFD